VLEISAHAARPRYGRSRRGVLSFILSPDSFVVGGNVRLNRVGLGAGLLRGRVFAAGVLVLGLATGFLGIKLAPKTLIANSKQSERHPNSPLPTSLQRFGSLPFFFEPNVGQTDSRVKFLARGEKYGIFLTANEAVLSLPHGHAKTESAELPDSVVE